MDFTIPVSNEERIFGKLLMYISIKMGRRLFFSVVRDKTATSFAGRWCRVQNNSICAAFTKFT